MAEEERQGSHLKAVLRSTHDRLEHEIRRADRAEQRADHAETRTRELCTRLGAADAARQTAEMESTRLKEEMKRFQMQIEAFERGLKRAQEDVDKLEKRRADAEDNASKSREAARKLQTAVNDYQTREDGREEVRRKEIQRWYDVGRQEGWDAGHADGFKEGKKEGFRDGKNAGFDEGKKSGREKGFNEGKERGRREERQHAMKAFEKLLEEEEKQDKQDRRGYDHVRHDLVSKYDTDDEGRLRRIASGAGQIRHTLTSRVKVGIAGIIVIAGHSKFSRATQPTTSLKSSRGRELDGYLGVVTDIYALGVLFAR